MSRLHAWLLSALLLPFASLADTFDLGPPGTLAITVPGTWTATGEPVGDQGYNITIRPKGDANAALRLTIFFGPIDQPVPDEDIQKRFVSRLQPLIAGSVEKEAHIHKLNLQTGSGFYTCLSDASLVGKPVTPGNYKVMATGMAKPAEGIIIAVTLFTDDKSSPEFAAGIKMIESIQLTRK